MAALKAKLSRMAEREGELTGEVADYKAKYIKYKTRYKKMIRDQSDISQNSV